MPGPGRPFQKGNPGKPKGAISQRRRYQEAFAKAFSEGDLEEVLQSLKSQAQEDPNAAHILLKYSIGLPVQKVEVAEVKDGFDRCNDAQAVADGDAELSEPDAE